MSQVKIQRTTGTGVSLSKKQLDIEVQFKNLQDNQQQFYNNLKLLIQSIFESYKKNGYKNDDKIKLLSSFLLLKNISNKKHGFNKIIVEQKENIKKYIDKILNELILTKIEQGDIDLSELCKDNSNNISEEHLNEISCDIFNIYSEILRDFSKELDEIIKPNEIEEKSDDKSKKYYNLKSGKRKKKRQYKKEYKKHKEYLQKSKINNIKSEDIEKKIFSSFFGIISKNQKIFEKTATALQKSGIDTQFEIGKNKNTLNKPFKEEKKQVNFYKKLLKRIKNSNLIQRKYSNSLNKKFRQIRAKLWLNSKRNSGKIGLFSKMLIKPVSIASKFIGIFGVVGGVLGSIISSSAKIIGKTIGWIGSKVKKITSFVISSVTNVVKKIAKPLIPLLMGFLMTPQGSYMMGFLYGKAFNKIKKIGIKVANMLTTVSNAIADKFSRIGKELKYWNVKLAHILLNFNFGKLGKLILTGVKELLFSLTPQGMIESAGQYIAGSVVSSIGGGLAKLAISKVTGIPLGCLGASPAGLAITGIVAAAALTGYGIYNFIQWNKKRNLQKKRKEANLSKYQMTAKDLKDTFNDKKIKNDKNRRIQKKMKIFTPFFSKYEKKLNMDENDERKKYIEVIKGAIMSNDSDIKENEKYQLFNTFIEKTFNELHEENLKLQNLHINPSDNENDYYIPNIDLIVNGKNLRGTSISSLVGNNKDEALKLRAVNLKMKMDNLGKLSSTKISDIENISNEKISFNEKLVKFFNNLNKDNEFKLDKNHMLKLDRHAYLHEGIDYEKLGYGEEKFKRAQYLVDNTTKITEQIRVNLLRNESKDVYTMEIYDYDGAANSSLIYDQQLENEGDKIYMPVVWAITHNRETPTNYVTLIDSIIKSEYFKKVCIQNKTEYYKREWIKSNPKNNLFNYLISNLISDKNYREKFNSIISLKTMWRYIKPLYKNINKKLQSDRKRGDIVLSFFDDMYITAETKMDTQSSYILNSSNPYGDNAPYDNIESVNDDKYPSFGKIEKIEIMKRPDKKQRRINHWGTYGRPIAIHVKIQKCDDTIILSIVENIYTMLMIPLQIYSEISKRGDIEQEYSEIISDKSGTVSGMAVERIERMGEELKRVISDSNTDGGYIDTEQEKQRFADRVDEIKQNIANSEHKIKEQNQELEKRKKEAQIEKESIHKPDESNTSTTIASIGKESSNFSVIKQRENRANLFKQSSQIIAVG